jgi:hypothetical protein
MRPLAGFFGSRPSPCRLVSKRKNAPYRSGRSERWFKVKCWKRGRFVVVGYVPEGSSGLLKLRFARREGDALVYAGRIGTRVGSRRRSGNPASSRAPCALHSTADEAAQEGGNDMGSGMPAHAIMPARPVVIWGL